jgi:putative ATP-dependent endonuclease of OLD family
MKIKDIYIKNYRLLKNFHLDLDGSSAFTMCIGKNNVGKTSLLTILDECLNNHLRGIQYEDFSLSTRAELLTILNKKELTEKDKSHLEDKLAIKLIIRIDYSDPSSDLSLIPLLSLDDKSTYVDIEIIKHFDADKHAELYAEYEENADSYGNIFSNFLEKRSKSFMKVVCYASDRNKVRVLSEERYGGEQTFFGITQSIHLYVITARRDVANSNDDGRQTTLSKYVHAYLKSEGETSDQMKKLNATIAETDEKLTDEYNEPDKGVFRQIIKDIASFVPGTDEKDLTVRSMLGRDTLVGYNNARIFYGNNDDRLPEGHSGLGYMNMYAMIIKLRTIIREIEKTPKNVIANLLFIEEPEAHTHPQMQYVFAAKIKEFLNQSQAPKLQTIVTTHSSHIVSQFKDEDDIVYFVRTEDNVTGHRIREFYKNNSYKKFLKQYLTVHRAELFFADKIIFVEGDTERLLLPYFMQIMDDEGKDDNQLLSQYISIIDVGNYSHIFKEFIAMLGVKTLIITDIDSSNSNGKCIAEIGTHTTNSSLNYFYNKMDYKKMIALPTEKRYFSLTKDAHTQDKDGLLAVTFQTAQGGYHARSFEDGFIFLNSKLLIEKKNLLKESTYYTKIKTGMSISYDADELYIKSKAMFAIDIINLGEDKKIIIPNYIRTGLEWLAK